MVRKGQDNRNAVLRENGICKACKTFFLDTVLEVSEKLCKFVAENNFSFFTFHFSFTMDNGILDVFGPVEDTTTDIIKVVGVGGGGCNAVENMYREGMQAVTFAVCNTDSKSLSANSVPTKIMLGKSGHGAGADPKKGREEAEQNIEELKKLFSDHTQMAFIVCAMGGGTGTGAGPLVAGIAKDLGLLTIGIVTLPFYFEKRPKIIKALKGLDEMRANVDALLIINNEQISKVFSDSHIPVNEALRRADAVMANAVRSISELITLNGKIQTDFSDVKTTMKNGGGAIMSIGRASGEHRVQNAVLNALQSPLLYGSDISKATRILFNIYTSSEHELFVDELEEIDAFMDELDPSIDVIWGMATDDTLDEDAKITILATGFENTLPIRKYDDDMSMDEIINEIYGKGKKATPNPDPSPVEREGGEDSNVSPVENDDVTETVEVPDNQESPMSAESPEKPIDPSRAFFNRVKNRFLQGLSSLTKEEE